MCSDESGKFPATEAKPANAGTLGFPEGNPLKGESQVFGWPQPFQLKLCFSLLQRKSSRAKEKKQKRLEERAAMDAVCAKVDAANRVTLPSLSVPCLLELAF